MALSRYYSNEHKAFRAQMRKVNTNCLRFDTDAARPTLSVLWPRSMGGGGGELCAGDEGAIFVAVTRR